MTKRASEQICSDFLGFLLKGIAEEPTCFLLNGSDNSPNPGDCKILRSNANLYSDCDIDAKTFTTNDSILRGVVWVAISIESIPNVFIISFSISNDGFAPTSFS